MNDRYGFNWEVKRHFANHADATAKGRLKNLLLITRSDSRPEAESKIQFFREHIQKVHNKPTVIGEFKTNLDAKVKYRCQVQLYFKQDNDATPPGKDPLDAQISFRLDETYKTITEAKYKALAARIKTELSPNDGHRWNKGKYLCLYDDPEQGYHFQVYAISKAEGIEVIKKVLSIQNHTYNDKLFRCTEPERNSDNTPGSEIILGETRQLPRWRPTSNVRFQYADLIVWNVKEPICLVDMTGMRANPVLRGWT
jgi:hypothetical protein